MLQNENKLDQNVPISDWMIRKMWQQGQKRHVIIDQGWQGWQGIESQKKEKKEEMSPLRAEQQTTNKER